MPTEIRGTYGFATDADRSRAEAAFREATAIPAEGARGDGPILSVTWIAPDGAYDAIRKAMVALSEAAAGGHVDLRAPGQGTLRCFGGETPWGFRSAETPEGASARLGSLAFHFDRGVNRAAFGPGGELAVAGMRYARGCVAVFDAAGAELLYGWAHDRPDNYYGSEAVAVALSPAGDRVISGSCDKRAVVREVRTGRPVAEIAHPEVIRDIAWIGDTIAVVGDRAIHLHGEVAPGKLEKRASLDIAEGRVLGHAAGVLSVQQGRGAIARIDVARGSIAGTDDLGEGIAAVSPGVERAIAPFKPGKPVKGITLFNGKKKSHVKVDAVPVTLAFAGDGTLYAALEDGAVIALSPAGEITERYSIANKFFSSTRLAIADDGRIAVATGDRVPVILDRGRRAITCAPDPLHTAVGSPVDPSFVVLGHRPRWIDPRGAADRPIPASRAASFSSDGALLAVHDGAALRLLDSATLTERAQKKTPTDDRLNLSPDGSTLAITGRDLSIFDIASGKARKIGKKGEGASGAAFFPDGRALAAIRDEAIALVDLERGSVTATLTCEGFEPSALAISPDGQRIAAASRDRIVGWDVAGRAQIFSVDRGAHALAWAPDGSSIAAGGWGAVTIVDGRDGAVKERLHGHLGAVYSVAFTGDGSHLVSVGEEGTALVFPRATSAIPVARPAPAQVNLAERVAAAEEAQKQKAAEASQAREEVRMAAPAGPSLPVAHNDGFAPGPAIPRHPMRLRAHGSLIFPSQGALDEGVGRFDANAYIEWFSKKDLAIADLRVTVDIETDLEVDCLTFAVSFQELARRAIGGAIDVAWDDQVLSMRFSAGSYGFEPVVPILPPAARARHGQIAAGLQGQLVSDGKGAFAAQILGGVALLDAHGAVTHRCPAAARQILAMDEVNIVALSVRSSANDREHYAIQRFDRATGAVLKSIDASARMMITRPGPGGFFLFYSDNHAQLCDLTPRVLATVKLDKGVQIDDGAASASGDLVALASRDGLFLWAPASTGGSPVKVPGFYASVAFLDDGDLVAIGSPDASAKKPRSFFTRIRPSGEIVETVKIGKDLARVRATPGGVLGSYDHEGILGSFGLDLKKRWMLDGLKRAGMLDMVPSADGRTLLNVSAGHAILGFDAATGSRTTDHASPILAMDATRDLIASLDESGELIVRARRTGEVRLRHAIALKAEKGVHLVFAAAGLAVADSDRLILVDTTRGAARELEKNKLTCAARAADGALVTGHADGKIRLLGDAGSTVIEVGGDIRRIAVSADAGRIACLFKDGIVTVFDRTGAKLKTIRASRDYTATLAISADGRTLAFTRSQKERYSTRGDVILLDIDGGEERVVLTRARPGPCAFTADGTRFFVADGRSIRSIDPVSGEARETIAGHGGEIRAIAIPGDGSLVSAGVDHTSIEWDLDAVSALCRDRPREETGLPE